MEPTLFGIGKAEWELYNSFSNWVAAFATLAAVWVALYLARLAGRPRAKVSVGHRLIVGGVHKGAFPEVRSGSVSLNNFPRTISGVLGVHNGAGLSTAAVLACDEPLEPVCNSGRTTGFHFRPPLTTCRPVWAACPSRPDPVFDRPGLNAS